MRIIRSFRLDAARFLVGSSALVARTARCSFPRSRFPVSLLVPVLLLGACASPGPRSEEGRASVAAIPASGPQGVLSGYVRIVEGEKFVVPQGRNLMITGIGKQNVYLAVGGSFEFMGEPEDDEIRPDALKQLEQLMQEDRKLKVGITVIAVFADDSPVVSITTGADSNGNYLPDVVSFPPGFVIASGRTVTLHEYSRDPWNLEGGAKNSPLNAVLVGRLIAE